MKECIELNQKHVYSIGGKLKMFLIKLDDKLNILHQLQKGHDTRKHEPTLKIN